MEAHRQRLLSAVVTLSSPLSATLGQRDETISRLVEIALSNFFDMRTRVVHLSEIITATESQSEDLLVDVIVLEVLDWFTYASPRLQSDFSNELMEHAQWQSNLTLGLLVAATAGYSDEEDDVTRLALIEKLSSWIVVADREPCSSQNVTQIKLNCPTLS